MTMQDLLSPRDYEDAKARVETFPFREWCLVKAADAVEFFDTQRKAVNYAKRHGGDVYRMKRGHFA